MKSTALLIIDVQRGYINKYTEKIPKLAEQKQLEYDLVWIARLEYGKNSPLITIRSKNGMKDIKNPEDLAFTPIPGSNIIVKHGYSAATPELLNALQKHNITQIDLMGVDTDQCVLATSLALFDLEITPRVLADYCASTRGEQMHEAGLMVMRHALGKQNIVES